MNTAEEKAIKALQAHKKVFTDYLSALEESYLRDVVVLPDESSRNECRGKVKLVWHLQKLLNVQLP